MPEALGHATTAPGPGCWSRPATRRRSPPRCGAWLGDAELRGRLRRAARERRASLRGWPATDVGRRRRPRGSGAMSAAAVRVSPRVARPARAGRRGGALGRARRAPRAAPPRDRPPRDPRPRRRQRRDGPLARAAAARAAALGGARPRRGPARARRRRPAGPAADGAAVTVEARQSDITRLAPHDLAGASAVVASALLDMLTADELAGCSAPCTASGVRCCSR